MYGIYCRLFEASLLCDLPAEKKIEILLQKEMLLLQKNVPQWISNIKKYIKVELKIFLYQPMILLF